MGRSVHSQETGLLLGHPEKNQTHSGLPSSSSAQLSNIVRLLNPQAETVGGRMVGIRHRLKG